MNKSKFIYGSLGLLSILGILGIVTEHKIYLAFFAFSIHLKYLFRETDEMMEAYMNKSAAVSFYVSHICLVAISFIRIFILGNSLPESIIFSLIISWIIAILVYTVSIVYYEWQEQIGIKND